MRIERRHLKHFTPSAASILLVLRHDYLLLNRQVAREALQILLRNHVLFLSCGPFVLKQLLRRIEESGGPGKQYLKSIKRIELEWVTFPDLRNYPPDRNVNHGEWWWAEDRQEEIEEDYVTGIQNRDEHDYVGQHYNDNFFEPEDETLYPTWPRRNNPLPASRDPFGFSTHYPFVDPLRQPPYDIAAVLDKETKLDLLVALEVAPLFDYLSSPAFALSSITLPLYFISKTLHRTRSAVSASRTLPTRIRYWVRVCVHALILMHTSPTLQEIRVKYMPQDVWASMDPADDLHRMADQGVWFRDSEDRAGLRVGEGEAFRAVWAALQEKGLCKGEDRLGLSADVRLVKWEGDLDTRSRVGDELEIVFYEQSAVSDGQHVQGARPTVLPQ